MECERRVRKGGHLAINEAEAGAHRQYANKIVKTMETASDSDPFFEDIKNAIHFEYFMKE